LAHLFYIYSFSWRFYPKRLTIAMYVRGRTPLEQLGVKCLAQGHIGLSEWIRTRVSHTKGMCHHHPIIFLLAFFTDLIAVQLQRLFFTLHWEKLWMFSSRWYNMQCIQNAMKL